MPSHSGPSESQDQVVVVSPAGRPDGRIVVGAGRAGALGVLDIGDGSGAARAELRLVEKRYSGGFGVRIATHSACAVSLSAAVTTIVVGDVGLLDDVALAGDRRRLVEVVSLEEARAAVAAGADGLIAKGSETGGRVGEESAFVLLQRLLAEVEVPVWAQGGIGPHTAAAAIAGGARGVVLDVQVALTTESTLPTPLRRAITPSDGGDTTVVDGRRVLRRPGCPDDVEVGQDAAFAVPFAAAHISVGGVVQSVRAAIQEHLALAAGHQPLAPGHGVATTFGTTYPIAQGPMTRVSDRAAFAASVSSAGAMPFLALSLLPGAEVRALMEDTRAAVGDWPWGVGVLGFVPPELRAEQLAVIRELRPPMALVAGGRPSQAAPLEEAGIPTFLHVPSPGLLDQFLHAGARRFVFEGRECGGHVGPRSSFVLWEQQITRLLQQPDLSGVEVLFAGGIHDDRSAAMVAAMAAPLTARGARIGVLMGTAYLFTEEAVACGAISDVFQQAALDCEDTVLVETAPGHATRCAASDFVAAFEARRTELEQAGAEPRAMWDELEALNLGRLRIAAKGLVREGGELVEVDEDAIRREGMFMLGQVAALHHDTSTVAQLHERVSAGSVPLLEELAPAARNPRPARPLRIAIIGMACVFPGAQGVDEFWSNVLERTDQVTEVPAERWDAARFYSPDGVSADGRPTTTSKWGGFLPGVPFEPTDYGIPPRSLSSIGTDQLISLQVASQALADAGYAVREFDRERTSVVFGAEAGTDLAQAYGLRTALAQFTETLPPELHDVLPELTEDSFPGVLSNVIAGRIANRLDLGGANYTVDAACGSSLAALAAACRELTTGAADMALCGAVDLHNGIHDYALFSATQALSPTGRCRPFDAAADGIALGEGVACVVLKRLDDAERDGDRILAVIDAVAAASDGRSLGLTAPRAAGQRRALERAYEDAGVEPPMVGLVEAHGTGTVVGDRTELATLTDVYAERGAGSGTVTLGSVKSQIGHTKCAAGLAGLIKVVASVNRAVLPPTRLDQPAPAYDAAVSPFVFNDRPRPWLTEDRTAAVSAFGFGGANFHAVVSGYKGGDDPQHGLDAWPAELFLLHGDPATIGRDVDRIEALVRANDAGGRPWRLRDLARTAYETAPATPVAAALVAESLDQLAAQLDAVRNGREHEGVVRGTADAEHGDVAFLFPGQGSQRVHMLGDLLVAFPGIRSHLAGADTGLAGRIFPPAAFGADRAAQAAALTDTRVAQPALGVVELALTDLLARCGVRPDTVAGHSFGELTALAVADAFASHELAALARARGQAILDASPADDPGTMAAVSASAPDVVDALGEDPGVVVANDNSPRQCVISGPTPAVEAAVARLAEHRLAARRIPVACAFHTPVLEAAAATLAERLGTMRVAPPRIPVWSNTTAAPYPAEADGVRALLARQVTAPVSFRTQIKAMYDAGVGVFVEAGPGRVLSQLVDAILGDLPHTTIACDVPGEPGIRRFLLALAELAALGRPVDLAPLFEGRDAVVVDASRQPRRAAYVIDGAHVRTADGEPVPGSLLPATVSSAIDLSTATAAVTSAPAGGERERLVTEYLRGMRDLVDSQRDIMLALLGADGATSPRPSIVAGETTERTPAPPLPAAATVAPPAAPTPAPTGGPVRLERGDLVAAIVAVVADRTGYPAEMLGPDLDLEAELSVDSIKRIEIVGELARTVGIPGAGGADRDAAVEELSLVKTIAAMADWILEHAEAAEAVPDAVPAPATAPVLGRDDLVRTIAAVVAERTGYPVEMLEPDLDLEAELSVDSIKRIEIVGELARTIGILGGEGADRDAAVEELSLVKTIAAMADWIHDHSESPAGPQEEQPAGTPPGEREVGADEPAVAGAAALGRFVPRLVDAPATTVERSLAGLAITIVGGEPQLNHFLHELLVDEGAHVELAAGSTSPSPGTTTLLDLSDLAPASDPGAAAVAQFERLRAATTAGVSELVVVTAMGGAFALEGPVAGEEHVTTGSAAAGMVKTFARELGVRARVVDVDPASGVRRLAERLVGVLRDAQPPLELGLYGDRTVTVATEPAEAAGSRATGRPFALVTDSVVVVTGGARGIGAATAVALARRHHCAVELLGRSPLPTGPEATYLSGAEDAPALRRAILDHGELTRPAEIEAEVARVLAAREIRANLALLREHASSVGYHAVDVTDPVALTAVLDGIRERHGRIAGIVHAAGVREDKLIRDKTAESFARVFGTKVPPTAALARSLDRESFLVLFASVAGCFGNTGQVDYAAANAALSGLARRAAATGAGPRVLAVDWGPWAGGGMVTPDLAREYARRGIGLIEPAEGVALLLDEIARGLPDAEVVAMCADVEAMALPPAAQLQKA